MKNKPMFDIAEKWLRGKGYDPVNPAAKPDEILDREATRKEYLKFMRQDVYEMLYHKGGVDEIWFLPDWQNGAGSALESRIAHFFDIPAHYIPKEIFQYETQSR